MVLHEMHDIGRITARAVDDTTGSCLQWCPHVAPRPTCGTSEVDSSLVAQPTAWPLIHWSIQMLLDVLLLAQLRQPARHMSKRAQTASCELAGPSHLQYCPLTMRQNITTASLRNMLSPSAIAGIPRPSWEPTPSQEQPQDPAAVSQTCYRAMKPPKPAPSDFPTMI
jgi:hypothetical protein